MSKTVVIHQPDFLPYLGFFHRFLHSDLWVIFDNVQFLNNSKSWHNRDKIKTPQGEKWLTVSVQKCSQKTNINEVLLADLLDWRKDNLNLIKSNYAKAPYFAEVFPYMEELYQYRCEKMLDFNLRSIEMLMKLLDINIEKKLASELNPEGTKNELLIDILKKVKADVYLSGTGAKDYLDVKMFQESGFEVVFQNFTHPIYSQLQGNFIPYLSSVDFLLNCGIEESRKIIRSI